MARSCANSFAILLICLLTAKTVNARIQSVKTTPAVPSERKLEIEEYPVQLEPFHIVYHHRRNYNFDGREEMDVLAATRNYLADVLNKAQPDNAFRRLFLYLFIREEDETMTKVAYSGTAFFAMPTSPSLRRHIQEVSWISFLGTNKTEYLLELTRFGIFDMDSITLLNAGGNVVGVDSAAGGLIAITQPPIPTNFTSQAPPNTDMMSSSVSMTIYLCAIIIPITVFFGIVTWWVVRKLRHDVVWKQPEEMDPEAEHWQSAQRVEQRFIVRPMTPSSHTTGTTFVTGLTHHHDALPTNVVVVPDIVAAEGCFLTRKPLSPVSEMTEMLQPGLPTNIVIAHDEATTSTLGTFTAEQKRKHRAAPSPLTMDAVQEDDLPRITKRQFVVSKPRNPVEKNTADHVRGYSAGNPISKTKEGKTLDPSKTKKKSRPATPQSADTGEKNATKKNTKKKKSKRRDTTNTPGPLRGRLPPTPNKRRDFTRQGLPPTPNNNRRDSATRKGSSTKRSSAKNKMDPQATKTLVSGVLSNEGAVLKPETTNHEDPPGTKLVTVKRMRFPSKERLPTTSREGGAEGAKNATKETFKQRTSETKPLINQTKKHCERPPSSIRRAHVQSRLVS